MKTTSYEISKKLAEIGFRTDSVFCYFKDPKSILGRVLVCELDMHQYSENHEKNIYRSYDLETILEALPYQINFKGKSYFFQMDQYCFRYEHEDADGVEADLEGILKESGSLADCAAKLLIKLFEARTINFKE